MDFGQVASFINPANIKAEVVTEIPFKKSRFTVDDAVNMIPLIVPNITAEIFNAQNKVVVHFKEELDLEPIKISSPEDLYSLSFNLLTSKLSKEAIHLIDNEDFSAALSDVCQIFSSAGNFISKIPKTAADVTKAVSRFCLIVPLEKIAKGIGAESYSITLGVSSGISFNFETEKKKGNKFEEPDISGKRQGLGFRG